MYHKFKKYLPSIPTIIYEVGCCDGKTTKDLVKAFPNSTIYGYEINEDFKNLSFPKNVIYKNIGLYELCKQKI